MKKFSILLTVIAILFTLIGCNSTASYEYDNSELYTKGDGEISELVHSIDINWVRGSVDVCEYDGETVKFVEEFSGTKTDENSMYYYYNEGTLNLKFIKSGNYDWEYPKKSLKVYLPKDSEIVLLSVSTVSANVSCKDISVNGIGATTVSGDLSFKNIDCKNGFTANSVSGNIDVSLYGKQEQVLLNSVSGKISIIADNIDNFETISVSGNIQIQLNTACKNFEIATVSGNSVVTLKYQPSLKLIYSTTSGNFTCNKDIYTNEGSKYTFGGGENTAKVDTTSGDLKIQIEV